MAKVRTNKAGNKFKLVLIIAALLMLVSHLAKQLIDSNKPKKEIMLNELSEPDSSTYQQPVDSIWHHTEFVQD